MPYYLAIQFRFTTILLSIVIFALSTWAYIHFIKGVHFKGEGELDLGEKLISHTVLLICYLLTLFWIYNLLQ
ncbi:MAG: hypothetical protein ABUT20_09285 [Bacteroidota bacterium]